jgi:hypothetical protein
MNRILSNIIPVGPWWNPPPGAGALDKAGKTTPTAMQPGPRFSCWLGNTHLYRPQPNPGAPAFAFEALGLVEFSPIGPSTINRVQLAHTQPGTLFSSLGLRTAGLGGLVQGQYVLAPLTVPNELSVDVGGDQTPFAAG